MIAYLPPRQRFDAAVPGYAACDVAVSSALAGEAHALAQDVPCPFVAVPWGSFSNFCEQARPFLSKYIECPLSQGRSVKIAQEPISSFPGLIEPNHLHFLMALPTEGKSRVAQFLFQNGFDKNGLTQEGLAPDF